MLSISAPIQGAGPGHYYLDLTEADYYANAREAPGQWYGRGATLLGLPGTVTREPFLRLLRGCSPAGQPLVQNAGHPQRQSGWDLTFSAPKSVSVFWAMADEPLRQRIEEIHERVVRVVLDYLQDTVAFTRRGPGGRIVERAALTFALFPHASSRANDPQLHTHVVLLNVGVRPDGTTGALKTEALFQAKMAAGQFYQRQLAANLYYGLGLQSEPAKVAFHLTGVPREVCRQFSQRRRQIEQRLAQRGQSGAVAAKAAALDTRPCKAHHSRAELTALWQRIGEQAGWGPTQARELYLASQEMGRTSQPLSQPTTSLPPPQSEQARSTHWWSKWKAHQRDRAARARLRRRQPVTPYNHPGWLRVERQLVFPKAPFWSPFKYWRLPVLVFGRRPQKWGYIRWQKNLPLYELRLQQRFLFPRAPRWSPVYKIKKEALRFVRKPSCYEHIKQSLGFRMTH